MNARQILFILLIPLFSFSLAQPSCSALVSSIETAFDEANEVFMATQVMQGSIEYAYTKIRLFKDDASEWQSEQVEQRGFPRPPETGGSEEEGDEPSFDFACDSHVVRQTAEGWLLEIEEPDEELPIKSWQLSFVREGSRIIPTEIAGKIDTRVFFIPFKGRFSVAMFDWVF